MQPHIHISALNVIVIGLSAILVLGACHVIARNNEGHPLADTFLNVFC